MCTTPRTERPGCRRAAAGQPGSLHFLPFQCSHHSRECWFGMGFRSFRRPSTWSLTGRRSRPESSRGSRLTLGSSQSPTESAALASPAHDRDATTGRGCDHRRSTWLSFLHARAAPLSHATFFEGRRTGCYQSCLYGLQGYAGTIIMLRPSGVVRGRRPYLGSRPDDESTRSRAIRTLKPADRSVGSRFTDRRHFHLLLVTVQVDGELGPRRTTMRRREMVSLLPPRSSSRRRGCTTYPGLVVLLDSDASTKGGPPCRKTHRVCSSRKRSCLRPEHDRIGAPDSGIDGHRHVCTLRGPAQASPPGRLSREELRRRPWCSRGRTSTRSEDSRLPHGLTVGAVDLGPGEACRLTGRLASLAEAFGTDVQHYTATRKSNVTAAARARSSSR